MINSADSINMLLIGGVILTIWKRIKIRRKELKLSQTDIASKSYISAGYLSEIETGKKTPSIATLAEISNALDIPVENLLSDKLLLAQKSEATEMFARLMKKLAAENPDLVVHFRDLDKNIDRLTPEDIQGIADSIAIITGKAAYEIEKRTHRESMYGGL